MEKKQKNKTRWRKEKHRIPLNKVENINILNWYRSLFPLRGRRVMFRYKLRIIWNKAKTTHEEQGNEKKTRRKGRRRVKELSSLKGSLVSKCWVLARLRGGWQQGPKFLKFEVWRRNLNFCFCLSESRIRIQPLVIKLNWKEDYIMNFGGRCPTIYTRIVFWKCTPRF